jgi:hypothetical protein
MCDLQARDACTRRMTVSPSPAKKCRQHGLTYIPTGWTTASRIVELRTRPPKDRCDTQVSTCAQDSAFNKPNLLKIFTLSSMFYLRFDLSDVEQWSRRLIQNPNRLPNATWQRNACARMTVSLKPHAPKSPARFDILFYSWTMGIQGSSNFVQGPPRTWCTTPHTRFQRARRFGLKQAKTLQFAVTSP